MKQTWGHFEERVVRITVVRWDEVHIWGTDTTTGALRQVCYGEENTMLTRGGRGSWRYLSEILWQGAVLNLVRVRRMEEGGICHPELIILEPDCLINVTTIAACFDSYAESPFVALVNRIKPAANSVAIHLGNLAGLLLDNRIHGREEPLEDTLRTFVARNSLSLITCKELVEGYEQFREDAALQKRNIDRLIAVDLPAAIGAGEERNMVLEPTFFSATLGIQGRFDLLCESPRGVAILEQKSGKGEFVPSWSAEYEAERPVAREQHRVQALLYRALYTYEFDQYAADVTAYLLYSKYREGLLRTTANPDLLLRGIRMRNLLAWCELQYANKGMDLLATLTPERLNRKGARGPLWELHTRPALDALLAPIHAATPLERAYYLRFMRFIAKENLLAKVGTERRECSGFASVWRDSMEKKKAVGNICEALRMVGYGREGEAVECVELHYVEPETGRTSNFRTGDIVILYPYKRGQLPDACAQMVHRANIADMTERGITLRLRNSQTDEKVFAHLPADTLWAIEHDMYESMTATLYSAMHSFLSAPKERRDLILSQRRPETDESLTLKGDYADFNALSLRAKRAKDLFLIIGPPGTGKTSFGLVNLLKEELLEEGHDVLLLSYTNRAVDEICSKLAEMKAENEEFDYIRIGSDLSCATEYRSHLLSVRQAAAGSGSEVKRMIEGCRVFCGTTAALNAHMALFALKHFSLAIIDEASQILEPHLIGLLSAYHKERAGIRKFVLIGDHKQLPAVVQQDAADSKVEEAELRAIHLEDCRLSLFERLLAEFRTEDGYDERYVYMLTKQGRMHREIAAFPNLTFYADKLDVVPLPHQQVPCRVIDNGNGIVKMLTSRRVVFVASEAPEHDAAAKTNTIEAEMIAATVRQIYELNADCFDTGKTVGVIVPYRNQISTIRNAIDRYGIPMLHDITIDTVERYQGSQRDYIIYGFTIQYEYQLDFLSNNVFKEDEALIDRKLNVAMTRARTHLIIIGNPLLLKENYTFAKLIDFAKGVDSYVEVPCRDYCQGAFFL